MCSQSGVTQVGEEDATKVLSFEGQQAAVVSHLR